MRRDQHSAEVREIFPDFQVGKGLVGHQKATLIFTSEGILVAFWNRRVAKQAKVNLGDDEKRSLVERVDDLISLPYLVAESYRERTTQSVLAEDPDNRFLADSSVHQVRIERRSGVPGDPSYECKIINDGKPLSILLGKQPDESFVTYLKRRYGDRCRF